MSDEQRVLPGADMEGFVRELVAFVGFDEADVAVIRRTAPVLLKHERAITDALYEHFLKFPPTPASRGRYRCCVVRFTSLDAAQTMPGRALRALPVRQG
ncbi:MAG: protoglobin domain-containing protein [Candidatus Entotheonellia bacterium]